MMKKLMYVLLLAVSVGTNVFADTAESEITVQKDDETTCAQERAKQCITKCESADDTNCVQLCEETAKNECRQAGE